MGQSRAACTVSSAWIPDPRGSRASAGLQAGRFEACPRCPPGQTHPGTRESAAGGAGRGRSPVRRVPAAPCAAWPAPPGPPQASPAAAQPGGGAGSCRNRGRPGWGGRELGAGQAQAPAALGSGLRATRLRQPLVPLRLQSERLTRARARAQAGDSRLLLAQVLPALCSLPGSPGCRPLVSRACVRRSFTHRSALSPPRPGHHCPTVPHPLGPGVCPPRQGWPSTRCPVCPVPGGGPWPPAGMGAGREGGSLVSLELPPGPTWARPPGSSGWGFRLSHVLGTERRSVGLWSRPARTPGSCPGRTRGCRCELSTPQTGSGCSAGPTPGTRAPHTRASRQRPLTLECG